MNLQLLNPVVLLHSMGNAVSDFIVSGNAAPTGLNLLLQTSLLLALGLLALTIARRRSPHLQTFICRASLLGVALSMLLSFQLAGTIQPAFNVTLPTIPARGLAPTTPPVAAASPPASVTPPAATADTVTGKPLNSGTFVPPPLHQPALVTSNANQLDVIEAIYRGFLVVWSIVTIGLFIWLALCHLYIFRLRLTSKKISDGRAFDLLHQLWVGHRLPAPALLTNPGVSSPLLCGLCRPAILLPATYERDYDTAALRAILLHELAHWQRRDLWWSLFCRILCALLWPQPLIWALLRCQEEISEEASDNAVLSGGCSPQEYASVLVNLAERLSLQRIERTVGAGVVPFRSSVGRRVQQILSLKRGIAHVSRRARAVIICTVLAAVVTASLSISVRAKTPSTANLSTPEAAVRSFIAALNEHDVETLAACVYEPAPPKDYEATRNHLQRFHQTSRFPVVATHIKKTESDGVTIEVEFKSRRLKPPYRSTVLLKLRQREGEWKLLTSKYAEVPPHSVQWWINAVSEPGSDATTAWLQARGIGEIAGRARWEDGRAAGNIQFQLVSSGNGYPELKNLSFHSLNKTLPAALSSMFHQTISTDAEGNFRTTALGGVTYAIVASKGPVKQPVEWVIPQPQRVTPQRGSVVTKDVILSRGSLLQARVVAQDSGKPIQGVEVMAFPGYGTSSFFQRGNTNSSGQAKLRVQHGKFELYLNSGGPGVVVRSEGRDYSVDRWVALVDGKVFDNKWKRPFVDAGKKPAHTIEFRLRRYIPPAVAPTPVSRR